MSAFDPVCDFNRFSFAVDVRQNWWSPYLRSSSTLVVRYWTKTKLPVAPSMSFGCDQKQAENHTSVFQLFSGLGNLSLGIGQSGTEAENCGLPDILISFPTDALQKVTNWINFAHCATPDVFFAFVAANRKRNSKWASIIHLPLQWLFRQLFPGGFLLE